MIRRPPRSTLFPTRRSSDLAMWDPKLGRYKPFDKKDPEDKKGYWIEAVEPPPLSDRLEDRKSTRLNSSHQIISYAVFCLKKKKKTMNIMTKTTNRTQTATVI